MSDQPKQVLADSKAHEAALGNGKDKIKIFQRTALCVFHQEDEDKREDIEVAEETEGTGVSLRPSTILRWKMAKSPVKLRLMAIAEAVPALR